MNYEKCRNDDNYCVLRLWKDFYKIDEWAFPINGMNELQEVIKKIPSFDDIVRCRREIQSPKSKHFDINLIPTDENIKMLRSKRQSLIYESRENL